jgi:4-hydroxybenzoate polyprenyltransferase
MLNRSTLLHLRIPFSFFLLPIFLFAISVSTNIIFFNTILAFVIIHFLLYPASNGFNSYFDKDEESIGGLENPPPVKKELYYTSIFLDIIAMAAGLYIGLEFVIMLLFYGLVSKAYSHPFIRLKKMPVVGWLTAGFFQGFFTFMMVIIAVTGLRLYDVFHLPFLFPALLTSILLWGSYPMTQVYQHKEDNRRGDQTISIKLGLKGTFIFSGAVFMIANAGFFLFYLSNFSLYYALTFQLFLLPMFIFFIYWFSKLLKDEQAVNYKMTMRLNLISAICMNSFFAMVIILKYI